MTVAINQPVPDIEFEIYLNETFQWRSLIDYRGKWLILLFYPSDFTFVCPTELKEAAARYQEITKLGAELMSISTDSVYAHQAWHESSPALQSISYPMAADPSGKLARSFGIYLENEGVSLRGTFIINPDGVLKAMDIHDNDIGRSISEIIRKLTACQYVAKHQGEACPADWSVGKPTVTTASVAKR